MDATSSIAQDAPPAYKKQIVYDRESKDFAMYLDGELVGYARTYLEGEVTLDQLVYRLLSDGQQPEEANPDQN